MRDTLSKANKAHEKRVGDLEENHEHLRTKQKDVHVKDRAELESRYQKNLNELQDKTASTIEKNRENFHQGLEKQRTDFEQDAGRTRKDFDQRLNDIKTSYQKSFESERTGNETRQQGLESRYNKNVTDLKGQHEAQIKEFSDRVSHTGADLKDQYNRERQQLVRSHEDHVQDVYASERKKQNELSHRVRQEMKAKDDIHESEKDQSREYLTSKLSKAQETHQNHSTALEKNYGEKMQKYAENQHSESLRTNREHQEQLANVRRDYNKDLRSIENMKRRRETGNEEFQEVANRQTGLSGRAEMEGRIRDLNKRAQQEKTDYQVRANREQEQYQENIKAVSAESAAQRDRKVNEVTGEKLVAIANERDKASANQQVLEKQNRVNQDNFERNLSYERRTSDDKVKNLKEHFNKSMGALEEKLQTSMSELNAINRKDKMEFIKKTNEKHLSDMFYLRREMGREMDATVQNYENKIANLQKENELLREKMDQKVSDIISYTDQKLETQKSLYEEQRKADQNDQKIAQDEREHQIKSDTNRIIVNFQQKLEKLQAQSTARIKLLTNEYENKLREQAALNSKELAHRDNKHKGEMDALRRNYETDKANLIATFNAHTESLKVGHAEQMEQLKNYKKLS